MTVSTLFINLTGAAFHAQALILAAIAATGDPTGMSDALNRLALLFAGIIGGVVAFFTVINGYMYITTAEDSRATYAKRAMGGLLFGALIVILGANIAPQIVSAIAGK